jgi:trehalose 6-phosphate synthase/phosphatase
MGLGLGFRQIGMESGFDALDTSQVVRAYRGARSRVIFLDYGGTTYSEDDKIDHIKVM